MEKSQDIVTNGCSGGCCETFTLPYTLEEFDLMIESYDKNKEEYYFKARNKKDNFRVSVRNIDEIRQIRNMIISLGESEINPKNNKTYNELYLPKTKDKVITQEKIVGGFKVKNGVIFGLHYTCKNFDTTKRICKIYETRPRLCRSFPSGGVCDYEKCNFNKVKKESELNK